MFWNTIPTEFLTKHYLAWASVLLIFFGELSLIIFGALSAKSESINLLYLMIACSLSAILSEQILFYISRTDKSSKKSLMERYKNHWIYAKISRQDDAAAVVLFAISRFFPILRIAAPIAMGRMQISTLLFTTVNIAVSSVWCIFYLGIGNYIGRKMGYINTATMISDMVANHSYYKQKLLIASLIVVVLMAIIGFFLYRKTND